MSKSKTKSRRAVHICIGVDKDMTCRFNGACYGYICIAPGVCLKKEAELTDEDRATMKRIADLQKAEGRP